VERGFEQEGEKLLTCDFEGYTSDRNSQWLGVEELRVMIEAEEYSHTIDPLVHAQGMRHCETKVYCT
jgi:hypothetical protein